MLLYSSKIANVLDAYTVTVKYYLLSRLRMKMQLYARRHAYMQFMSEEALINIKHNNQDRCESM